MVDILSAGSMPMEPVYSGGGYVNGDAPVVQQAQPQVPVSAHSAPQTDVLAGQSDAEIEKLMEEPIKQANKTLSHRDRMIERAVHEVTKTLMYVVKDTKTNEVIAEYPPRKIQDMIAKMWELAGLFVDEKA